MLSLKLLWRNWRSGEIKILTLALLLAIVVTTAINVFAERLEASLLKNSHSFLAADRLLESSSSIPDEWSKQAHQLGIEQGFTARFSSVAYSETQSGLVAIKAVSNNYPLLGDLLTSTDPFASITEANTSLGPPSGEAWVDARVLALLSLNLGSSIEVGERKLTVTRVIIREPDRGAGFSLFAPRVLINYQDLESTQIIQPGSRVKYGWLLSASNDKLDALTKWLTPQLTDHQSFKTLDNAQLGLKRNLEKAQSFMRLAAVIGVLLAGIAIAINAQVFARKHTETIALMKSLGLTRQRLRRLYLNQLLILGLLTSAIGMLIGLVLEQIVVYLIRDLLDIELVPVGWQPYALSLVAGVMCLLSFALPYLWHLPSISPLRILRQDVVIKPLSKTIALLIAIATLVLLAWLYSRNFVATAVFAVAIVMLIVFGWLLSKGLWWLLQRGLGAAPVSFRLAMTSIIRHPQRSYTQVIVFASIAMLLLIMVMVRTNLIRQWQLSIPEDAPNHFVMNIAQDELDLVTQSLSEANFELRRFYPIVRGRVATINGAAPSEALKSSVGVLGREANLSTAIELPAENRLISGQWWTESKGPQVSVEAELAQDLGLALGDDITFSIGGLQLTATVSSTRELNWDSMKPNFFFLLSPGALDDFTPSYLTTLHTQEKPLLYQVLREYPTVAVIDIDSIIDTIRDIIAKVSVAVEFMLWIILLGGFLVMISALNASMAERWQSAALMRAVGGSKKQLRTSLSVEFSIVGLTAGILASVGAFVVESVLKRVLFDTTGSWSLWYGLAPVLLALVIVILGLWFCRRVIVVAPMRVLRDV